MFVMDKQRVISIAIFLGLSGFLFMYNSRSEKPEWVAVSKQSHGPVHQNTSKLTIHIAGAVTQPGLYRVTPNARVIEVLPLAGGVISDANLDKVNLAALVKEGQRVYIPFKKVETVSDQTPITSSPVGKININTASLSQLVTIKGIGPATAKRILEYRTKNGPFKSIKDLENVKGVGPKTRQKITTSLCL